MTEYKGPPNIYYMALYRNSLLYPVLGKESTKCKSSEASVCLAFLRNSKEVSTPGVE